MTARGNWTTKNGMLIQWETTFRYLIYGMIEIMSVEAPTDSVSTFPPLLSQ